MKIKRKFVKRKMPSSANGYFVFIMNERISDKIKGGGEQKKSCQREKIKLRVWQDSHFLAIFLHAV